MNAERRLEGVEYSYEGVGSTAGKHDLISGPSHLDLRCNYGHCLKAHSMYCRCSVAAHALYSLCTCLNTGRSDFAGSDSALSTADWQACAVCRHAYIHRCRQAYRDVPTGRRALSACSCHRLGSQWRWDSASQSCRTARQSASTASSSPTSFRHHVILAPAPRTVYCTLYLALAGCTLCLGRTHTCVRHALRTVRKLSTGLFCGVPAHLHPCTSHPAKLNSDP